jgi:hypothetical protein
VLVDNDGTVFADYFARSIPTTIVVGRDGTVKRVFIGFDEGDEKSIDEAIQAALAEKAKK